MIPKVFLDTNILLDLFLERPGYEDSARILQAGDDGKVELFCSFLTIANLAFILRKTVSSGMIVPTLMQISSLIKVLPMDEDLLKDSFHIAGRDFEDILQAVCACKGGCSHIVTRNTADFSFSSVDGFPSKIKVFPEVCAPDDFLKNCLGSN